MNKERLFLILSNKSNRNKKTLKSRTKNRKEKQINYSLDLALTACKAANDKKGENIALLDVSKLTVISDYFLIISANSKPHLQSLSRHIEDTLSKLNINLVSKEGINNNTWAVLDFGEVIVHIMMENERSYYKLESFWRNATFVDNKLWKKAS